MHGKSGSFASQNLRFRNVKSKLSFSVRIIFTKLYQKPVISVVDLWQNGGHNLSFFTRFSIMPLLACLLFATLAVFSYFCPKLAYYGIFRTFQ
ncbi:hypothetical protein CTM62_12060 [Prevotella intermedia]|uniref:Uncharacterized protein n=1 Tax=Prevotella intermedia TaxID=28131 RepID=A0A2D3LA62_PREIN|nr:hypothetical protein CTM62_12060 [Prevotella intermedia]